MDAGRYHKPTQQKSSRLYIKGKAVKLLSNLNSTSFQLFHLRHEDLDLQPFEVDKNNKPSRIIPKLVMVFRHQDTQA